jgi:hypothetical protein
MRAAARSVGPIGTSPASSLTGLLAVGRYDGQSVEASRGLPWIVEKWPTLSVLWCSCVTPEDVSYRGSAAPLERHRAVAPWRFRDLGRVSGARDGEEGVSPREHGKVGGRKTAQGGIQTELRSMRAGRLA